MQPLEELDYIPFEKMVKDQNRAKQIGSAQGIHRYFPTDCVLSSDLIVRRTNAFDAYRKKVNAKGKGKRDNIIVDFIKDGRTVGEINASVRKAKKANKNRVGSAKRDADIIIAAYRGLIRLEMLR